MSVYGINRQKKEELRGVNKLITKLCHVSLAPFGHVHFASIYILLYILNPSRGWSHLLMQFMNVFYIKIVKKNIWGREWEMMMISVMQYTPSESLADRNTIKNDNHDFYLSLMRCRLCDIIWTLWCEENSIGKWTFLSSSFFFKKVKMRRELKNSCRSLNYVVTVHVHT